MYSYETERPYTLTDEGQRNVMAIFVKAQKLLETAGVARADKLMEAAHTGESWRTLACLDRCVEMGLLRKVPTEGRATQHQVYEGRYES